MGALKHFSDLPVETVIYILTFLTLEDLHSFSITSRTNHAICTSTTTVQYHPTLRQYGMVDGGSTLGVSSKLTIMKRKERSWQQFTPGCPMTVSCPHQASSLYELENGLYISGVSTSLSNVDPEVGKVTALRVFDMKAYTENGGTNAQEFWRNIELGIPGYSILEVASAIQESDLIVTLIKKDRFFDVGERTTFAVHLLQFSASRPHPLAKKTTIRLLGNITEDNNLCPAATVLVSGRYLLVLFKWPYPPGLRFCPDILFVVDWWSGNILTRKSDFNREVGDVALLTKDLIVIPNISTGRLEIARLPSLDSESIGTQTDLETVFILALPYLHIGVRYRSAHCRASTNAFGCQGYINRGQLSRSVYTCDPERAIILTRLSLEGNGGLESTVLWLIFRRSDIIDFMRGYNSKSSFLHRLPGVRRDVIVPWEKWGPHLTRWRQDREMTFWMTTAAGQRLAFLRRNKVRLWDFNPYAVKKALKEVERSVTDRDKVVDYMTVLRSASREPRFMQEIHSNLPYVEREFELPRDFRGIHLDDGHLIAFDTAYPSDTVVQEFTIFPV